MASNERFPMSQQRYDELQAKLQYNRNVRTKEVAELIKEARGFGDLSENSEYDEAKNEQGKLASEIAELEYTLNHAVIVDESDIDLSKVSIGCVVTVVNLENGKKMPPYEIVGSKEADVRAHKISESSPFGKAMIGAVVGDEVVVEAPAGLIHYRVTDINR